MAEHRQAIADSTKSIVTHAAAIADARMTNPQLRALVDRGRDRAEHLIRHRDVPVDIDKLLLGGPEGMTAKDFARRVGDRTRPSIRLIDGPQSDLYRRFVDGQEVPGEGEVAADVPYVTMALACIDAVGSFHGCTTLEDVERLIERRRTRFDASTSATERGTNPVVRPIRGSDYFEVVDGHERLASAWARGEHRATADITWSTATTPVQDLLARTGWLAGQKELYQPLQWPEIQAEWPLIRASTDRLEMMQTHLARIGVTGGSYLDIASCYGWFVAQMAEAGFDAEGIEMDPLGVELGELAYGLPAERVTVGAAEQLLRFAHRTWDVVSCMSIVHHHAIMGGEQAAAEMFRLLDSSTAKVLYFDTGQSHEAWFAEKLPGWDDAGVAELIRTYTSFTNIEILGRDSDNVGRYAKNYSRAFFACTRD